MYSIARKERIIELLEKEKEVTVNHLAEIFGVSRETIRRDLGDLENGGILTRTHGGAVFSRAKQELVEEEYPLAIRSIQRHAEKNEICRYAASLIDDNDTIFVDNSSTTMYLIKYIPLDLRVTVITNSLKLLLEAAKYPHPNISCFCLGGTFKEVNLSFYGNTSLKNAEAYYPNKAFVGCAGIRRDGTLTDSSMQEVDTKRLMLNQSARTILLVDHTKFSAFGQVHFSNISPSITVVTDGKTSREDCDFVRSFGAQLIQV